MSCRVYIQRFIFTAFVVVPFFVLAQAPSIETLETQLAHERAEYAARIKHLGELETRLAAVENARLQAQAASRPSGSAKHVSPNFEVTAPTREIAEKVCAAAEAEWAKSGLPNLYAPCQIRVKVGQIGVGGATTFSFGGGQVFGFDMTVQGDLNKILKAVIPHEVRHMITACHKRRPLSRWFDEGIATLCEEDEDRVLQINRAREVAGTNRFIPIRELFLITEYPKNMQNVLTLYAEGAAMSEFLISRASSISGETWTQKEAFQWMMDFEQATHVKGWDAALFDLSQKKDKPLGNISNVSELSNEFIKWLKSGKADLYTFKESVVPLNPIHPSQNQILPVKNTDQNNYVTPLGR